MTSCIDLMTAHATHSFAFARCCLQDPQQSREVKDAAAEVLRESDEASDQQMVADYIARTIRPDMGELPQFAPVLAALNAPQMRADRAASLRRAALVTAWLVGTLAALIFAGVALADGYDRVIDAMKNPHIEGRAEWEKNNEINI